MKHALFFLLACGGFSCTLPAQNLQDSYTKLERRIPMRDGTKLFTAIYLPKDTSTVYPFLVVRTPYSSGPYGEDRYPRRLGPNHLFAKEKYIFVYQDVRGRYLSEGRFQEMTPAIDHKQGNQAVDESSDTYDTVDWLLKNIPRNNGKAGIYGISYPGFYASAALPDAHPAIKAVSPQAPVTDEFEGDDANHRGAFFLMDNFSFLNFFDHPRSGPWKSYPPVNASLSIPDAYAFYLAAGPIQRLNPTYFHDSSVIWNEYLAHTTKDAYWQARDIRPHLKNVQPAVLVVGGWFDAEDLFGALKTYEAIEKQSPGNNNRLLMGPWTHGAWEQGEWNAFAGQSFGSNTSAYFQQKELAFFNFYLKEKGRYADAEATVFVTGSNEWKSFTQWPPREATRQTWYLQAGARLAPAPVKNNTASSFDEYVSNPANPVPYIDRPSGDRINEYMAADQRFAAARKDVLHYTTSPVSKALTLCGPVTANLYVSLSTTDADFVVKLIDVLPDSTQQLVRAEVIRGKFRNSWERPEPFIPGSISKVQLVLNDIAHTFAAGHRLMVQVQSSWFPLVDRNPQTFVDIAHATEKDFQSSTIRIYHDLQHPSAIEVRQLP